MILSVDLDSDVPLYQQLRDRVVEAIATGELLAGDSLPSTRQLASDLGINFHTVNKGYDALRAERLVRLSRKSGAVVQRDPWSGPAETGFAEAWEPRLRTLLAEARAQGMPPHEIVDRCRQVVAGFRTETREGGQT